MEDRPLIAELPQRLGNGAFTFRTFAPSGISVCSYYTPNSSQNRGLRHLGLIDCVRCSGHSLPWKPISKILWFSGCRSSGDIHLLLRLEKLRLTQSVLTHIGTDGQMDLDRASRVLQIHLARLQNSSAETTAKGVITTSLEKRPRSQRV